jgi:predicted nucleic acid-binding protein
LYKPHLEGDTLSAINFMTSAELEQWAVFRRSGPAKRDELISFAKEEFVTIDSNEALCAMWAEVRGQANRVGRQIDVADAWIAATALLYNAELVTHNAGHFDFCLGFRLSLILEKRIASAKVIS